ncbi:hypothetical protein GQX74_002622 [Glossina fuscipes]|nr:hypothetical protein GQX74_002622 [Glossina fuscipes]
MAFNRVIEDYHISSLINHVENIYICIEDGAECYCSCSRSPVKKSSSSLLIFNTLNRIGFGLIGEHVSGLIMYHIYDYCFLLLLAPGKKTATAAPPGTSNVSGTSTITTTTNN